MKYSKILIFILSVILLIVVIKCVRGVSPREGFVRKFIYSEGTGSQRADTNDEKQLRYNIMVLANIVNEINDSVETLSGEKDTIREYVDELATIVGKDDFETKGTKIGALEDTTDLYTNITMKEDMYNSVYNLYQMIIDLNTRLITQEANNSIPTHTHQASEISGEMWVDNSEFTTYKTKQAAKDSTQDTALSTYITSQVEKDSKQDTALSTYITSQVEKDSEQTEELVRVLDEYKETQKATDNNQNDIRDAFIENQYPTDIASIKKSIKKESGSLDRVKKLQSIFDSYKATQAVTDTTQDKEHNALNYEFSTYSEGHTKNHSDLNEDISSYRTDHAMIHATEQTRVNAEFNDQDTALSKWEDIFKSAQVNLGIRIKCQNKKTGEWGKTPGEFCPDWFKASVPK